MDTSFNNIILMGMKQSKCMQQNQILLTFMIKNRRKSNYTPFSSLFEEQTNLADVFETNDPDKENQAKLILLGVGNEETIQPPNLMFCTSTKAKTTLIQRMRAHQEKQTSKTATKQHNFEHCYNALTQIDNNINWGSDNFLNEDMKKPSTKKQRFSMRNVICVKSKQNIENHSKDGFVEAKKQEKTILKLKGILKKLESPQKIRKPLQNSTFDWSQNVSNSKQQKTHRVFDQSSQFIDKSFKEKLKNEIELFSNSRLLSHHKGTDKPRCLQYRSESKTSHKKQRSDENGRESFFKMTPCSPVETPTKAFYKKSKLTNQNELFKQNSVAMTDLMKKNNYTQCFRKQTQRNLFNSASKCNVEKSIFEDVFLQQERMKEERKSRNLKNILFD